MKKIYIWSILTLIIATFLPGGLCAQENASTYDAGSAIAQRETGTHVTADEARAVGLRFLNANTSQTRGAGDLQMATAYRTSQGDTAFYVFNTANGFVMVAADRCATPILGYSDEGPFNVSNVPVQMQSYLHGFVEQIAYGIGHSTAVDATTAQQWQEVLSSGHLSHTRSNDHVDPLITANWGQGCYYNAMCPENPNGQCGHVPTGCVATAMGMIMHYWGFPTHGNGTHTYTPDGYPAQTANFNSTTYDWPNMPDQLTTASSQEEVNAVSTLLWHCGVALDMQYDLGGSGAFVQDMRVALGNVFNYSCSQVEELGVNQYITTNQWFSKIKSNLDDGMPILYSGYSGDDGHAWVCDGYDADSLLHFNWGWNGVANGYFAIGASNVWNYEFNDATQTIFDIHPQCDANSIIQITANVNNSSAGYVIGAGSFGCEQECTLTAIPYDGYHFVKWIETYYVPSYYSGLDYVISLDSNYSFHTTSDRVITAVFAANGDGCDLLFDIYDSGGDGMNGCNLQLNYGDGSWENLTFGSGSIASFTREFLDTSHIEIWVSTFGGNYWNEISYDIKFENGAIIYHQPNINAYLTNNHYEFDLNCEDQFTPRTITVVINPEDAGSVTGGGTYNPGDTCTLTAVPDEGHVFACWEENGEIVSYDTTLVFVVGITNRTLKANFGPYSITTSSNLDEGGAVTNGGSFNYGDTCTITAIANEGYVFLYWTENGNVVSCSNEYSFLVTKSMNMTAIFAEESTVCNISLHFNGFNWIGHEMIVNYGNGISEIIMPEAWANDPSYTRYVYDGSHINLSWTNGGYTWGFSFDVLYGNGSLIHHGNWNDNSQYKFDVDCSWAYTYHNITTEATPEEAGSIVGAGEYHWGDTCTLVATPNEGFDFLYWSENGVLISRDSLFSFMVNEDRNLIAHFVSEDAEFCNLVFELGSDNSWWPGNLLIVGYGDGVCEQLTTEWDENHTTTGYAIHTRPIINGNQITLGFVEDYAYDYCVFDMHYQNGDSLYRISGLDNNFHGVFNANCEDAIIDDTYAITVTANFSDGGTVEGSGDYSFGQTCTLTATPEENCIFAHWKKGSTIVSYSPTYSFQICETASYEAVFMKGILIGETSTSMGYLPSESCTKYSFSKQIYTSNEIGLTGVIESVAFYSGETKTRNYAIYLVNTSMNSFSSGDVEYSNEDLSFKGEVILGANRWNVIELSTPYYYNGIDNIAIIVIDSTDIESCGLVCSVFDTDESQALYGFSFDTPFSISNTNIAWGPSFLNYKNQVFFGGVFTDVPPRVISATTNFIEGGTVSGAGTYNPGETATLTATPNNGYTFLNWTENGSVVSYDSTYSFTVTYDRNLTANFAEEDSVCRIVFHLQDSWGDGWNNNYLVVNVDTGGSLQLTIESGWEATYSIQFLKGTHLNMTRIVGDSPNECSFNVSYENGTVIYEIYTFSTDFSYEFDVNCDPAPIYHTLFAEVYPENGGTVSGAGTYDPDATATLTATPNLGYLFSHWSDGSTENPHTITVTGDMTFNAYFVEDLVNVTAISNDPAMGTVLGGGSYPRNSEVTLAAVTKQGFSFLGWDNGAPDNPYTFTVSDDISLTALFSAHDTTYIDVHDTTYLWQYDTTYVDVPYPVHDTTYVDVPYPVHDTTYLWQYDTTYVDVPYPVHDTTYVDVHDTTYLWQYDTTYVDVPYPVHDTTYVDVHDTTYLWQYDTTYVNVPYPVHDTTYVDVHDTTYLWLYDTTYVDVPYPVHDTTYVDVHDTTYLWQYDTTYVDVPYPVHDTTYIDVHDTTYLWQYDTTYVDVPYPIHDTTYLWQYDTTYIDVPYPVHDTTYVNVHDTTYLWQYDTTYVDVPYPVHDTTYVDVHDTTYLWQHDTTYVDVPYPVHDTTYVDVHDTTYLWQYDTTYVNVPFPVYDTTYVNVHDTTYLWQYDTTFVTLHDTTVLTIHDTTYIDVPYLVHDTTFVTLTDTVVLNHYDTTYIDVPYPVHDTTYVTLTDTIVLNHYDTTYITLHDTITITEPLTWYSLQVLSEDMDKGVGAGSGQFPEGTDVEIAAIPIEGNHFLQWSDGSDSNPRTITLNDNITLTAMFTTVGVTDLELPSWYVYPEQGAFVVKGTGGHQVSVYDAVGKLLHRYSDAPEILRYSVPAAGSYYIQVDNGAAKKVTVVR